MKSGYNLTLSDNLGNTVTLCTDSDHLDDVNEMYVRAMVAMTFTEKQVIRSLQEME